MERFFVHWAHGLSDWSVIFVLGPLDIMDMKRFLIDANHFLTVLACGILLLSCAGHPGRRTAVETLHAAEADQAEFGFIPDADDGRLCAAAEWFERHGSAADRISAWTLLGGEDTEAFFARLGFRPEKRESGSVEMVLPGNEISLDSCANCAKRDCPNRSGSC